MFIKKNKLIFLICTIFMASFILLACKNVELKKERAEIKVSFENKDKGKVEQQKKELNVDEFIKELNSREDFEIVRFSKSSEKGKGLELELSYTGSLDNFNFFLENLNKYKNVSNIKTNKIEGNHKGDIKSNLLLELNEKI